MGTLWIWDIDGTCIDSSHRDHLFDSGDFEAAFSRENLRADVVMPWVWDADLWRHGQFRYRDHYGHLTARHDDVYDATVETLTSYGMWGATDPIARHMIMKDTPRAPDPRCEPPEFFKTRVMLELAKKHYEDSLVLIEDHPGVGRNLTGLRHPRIHVVASTQPDVAATLAELADTLGASPRW